MRKPKIKTYNLSFSAMSNRAKTTRIILHHSAGTGGAEAIHRNHKAKGWAGIGYHYVVRKDGTIEQGRPLSKVGSHAASNNSDSIGICAEGNYETTKTMPTIQRLAIAAIGAWVAGKYGVKKVQGHCETKATACPGKHYPLGSMKTAILGQGTKTRGYVVGAKRYLYPSPKKVVKSRIAPIEKGTVVEFAGEKSGRHWRKVTVGGKTGWVKITNAAGAYIASAIRW